MSNPVEDAHFKSLLDSLKIGPKEFQRLSRSPKINGGFENLFDPTDLEFLTKIPGQSELVLKLSQFAGHIQDWELAWHLCQTDKFTSQNRPSGPNLESLILWKTRCRVELGDFLTALSELEALEPTHPDTTLQRDYLIGICHHELGHNDKARAAFEKVFNAKSNYLDIREKLKSLGVFLDGK